MSWGAGLPLRGALRQFGTLRGRAPMRRRAPLNAGPAPTLIDVDMGVVHVE